MGVLLDVHDLRTQFLTQDGMVNAVNGVSFHLDEGETLGIVGESGCGKSVTMLSIMRLIPQPPGRISAGQVLFHGTDLIKISDDQMRRIRGHKIAMIFQDPMTSLNPVLTIGRQISEALELHLEHVQEPGAAPVPLSCCSWSTSPRRPNASTTIPISSPVVCASVS